MRQNGIRRVIAMAFPLQESVGEQMISTIIFLFSAVIALGQEPQQATQKLVKPTLDEPSTKESGPVKDKGSTDKVIEFPTRQDDARTEKLLVNMAKRAGWFPEVKIHVQDGLVTLEGKAKNVEQLQWLAKTADRIPTVVAVINQVELEQPPASDLTPAWKEFRRLIESAKKALPLIVLALALGIAFWFIGGLLSRSVEKLWGRRISNPFLLATVSRITMFPIWLLFFYLVLQTAGLSSLAATIIGGTGAVGIVIGFAFKDIAENYLSGLLLAMRSPFTKGDEIAVDKFEGYVQSLNMRGTTIIDYDGNVILIPNRIVIQSVIKNKTSNPKTRVTFTLAIGYADSVGKAQNLILEALKKIPDILQDPAPSVVASEIDSGHVNLSVIFWYDGSKSSSVKTRSLAITAAKENLLANGMTVPAKGSEVRLGAPIEVRMLESDEGHSTQPPSPSANPPPKSGDLPHQNYVDQGHERDAERVANQALPRVQDSNTEFAPGGNMH